MSADIATRVGTRPPERNHNCNVIYNTCAYLALLCRKLIYCFESTEMTGALINTKQVYSNLAVEAGAQHNRAPRQPLASRFNQRPRAKFLSTETLRRSPKALRHSTQDR